MSYPTAEDYLSPAPDRHALVAALSPLAAPTNAGVWVFLAEALGLWIALAGVIWLPELWMRIAASVFAGLRWANFIVLAHDAAHGNMAKSPRVSRWIALYTLTHCMFNFRVWSWDHHRWHHPHPSSFEHEAWRPLSLAEYRAATPFRRLRERLYRAPILVNFGLYLIAVRGGVIASYFRENGPAARRAALGYFAGQGAAVLAFWALLLAAPLYSERTSLEAWLLGFALPFLIFSTFFGVATYLQHTHPNLPWYREPTLVPALHRQELMAAAQTLPWWLSAMSYHVQFHSVHHVHPRIPVWRLKAGFVVLQRMCGPVLVHDTAPLSHLVNTLRRCKLYDYGEGRWLDFKGRPTTEPIPLAVVNARLARAGATPDQGAEGVPASMPL